MNQHDPSTTPAADATQVIHTDPRGLLVDSNIRQDLALTKAFLGSIKDQGVLVPLTVVRTVDGDLRVRFGHRRNAAAIEADLPTVPVIVAADEATEDAATVERLVGQYAENEHRSGLSNAERVAAVEQMALLGVSAAQITKRLRTPRTEVDAALAVSASTLAKVATVRYDFLDLSQAAAVAEFDDDDEAVKALVTAAKTGQFAHVVQRLRDRRAEQQRRQDQIDALTATGVTVIAAPGTDRDDEASARLSSLIDADGKPLDETNHVACPGHAAYLTEQYGWLDATTGEPVTDDTEDSEDAQDSAGAEDNGNAEEPVWGTWLATRYACTDPAGNGHTVRSGYGGGYSTGAKPKAADMTDAERAAAKAERKDVIDSNKAWRSAEVVRREWLTTFLARRTAPKTAGRFLATSLASADHALTQALTDGHAMAATLLGLDRAGGLRRSSAVHQAVIDATDARAQVIHLALVLGAYEAATGTHSWRSVNPSTATYLTWIAANGYTLSPVERRASGLPGEAAEDANDEATAEVTQAA